MLTRLIMAAAVTLPVSSPGQDDQPRAPSPERIKAAVERALPLIAKGTEDRVFRLCGLKLAGAPDDDLGATARVLRDSQRDDGGWAQLDGGDSDAYATGTALVALHLADDLATDDSAYRRGLEFLVKTQKDDGSWHVASRSRPIQLYFETGFPHGKDQFISMSATAWAIAALALAGPRPQ